MRRGHRLSQITGKTKLYSILNYQSTPIGENWHSFSWPAGLQIRFLLLDSLGLKEVQSSAGAGSQRKHKGAPLFLNQNK